MAAQEVFDQRLDAVDRALLGVLPRSERLAIVADIEARLRESGCADAAETADATPAEASAVPAGRMPRRRSRLALTSGIVGIVAVAMLVGMPLMYLLVAMLGEVMGEEMAYGLLALSILAVACSGAAAVMMGITALVRLGRRRGGVGHGWAITGLCTGPMPALVGMLGMLTFVLPLTMELMDSASVDSSQPAYVSDVPQGLPATAASPGTPTVGWPGQQMPSAAPAVETAALPQSPYGAAPLVAPTGYTTGPATPASEPTVSPGPPPASGALPPSPYPAPVDSGSEIPRAD
jgi:hypothetical protein